MMQTGSYRDYGSMGINRYMLGCKFTGPTEGESIGLELIDTCWDVNLSQRTRNQSKRSELIDTCWDVNL